MITIVDRPDIADQFSVCGHCEGGGRMSQTLYYNPHIIEGTFYLAQLHTAAATACVGGCSEPSPIR